jgi:hypothetical protein
MWTKSKDLQNKYVKLSFQQDYETVTKVLHEFEFRMYDGIFNDGYYESYPFLNFYSDNTYYTSIDSLIVYTEIPIQQFYDYLKPKTLKVEDLVEGEVYKSAYGNDWLFKYNENNDETVYYLTPTSFSKSSWGFYKNKTITPCSPEEKKWLEACIKADKFIPKEEALKVEPKYEYEVVHCTTQEEWDFVRNKCIFSSAMYKYETWEKHDKHVAYPEGVGICIKEVCYSGLSYWKKHNAKIYSFQEWCDKFGHKPDFKFKFENNKWYKTLNTSSGTYYVKNKVINGHLDSFKEYICDDKHYYCTINLGSEGTYKYELLTDLSEIQQYLPDGHVDKIKVMKEESLVGRYLKALIDYPEHTDYKKNDFAKIVKDINGEDVYLESHNFRASISRKDYWELIPKGFTPDNIIPEYVEVLITKGWFTKGEILKTEKYSLGGWKFVWSDGSGQVYSSYYKDYYKPSTKEAYDKYHSKSTDTNWIPEVGEYAVMVDAGGWSYSFDNNGCVAKITEVNAKQFYNGVKTYTIAGKLINPKTSDYNSFNSIPLINSDKKLICRKALPHEIPNNNEVVLTPKTFDLSNTKIRVDTPELSKLVQEKAFKLGLYWGNKEKKVDYQIYKFLYFSKYKTITYGDDSTYFQNHFYKEIFPSDLGINIVNKEIRSIVNIGKNEYPVTSNEVFQQEGLIDTNVNKIQSVSVELYQPEELQLF